MSLSETLPPAPSAAAGPVPSLPPARPGRTGTHAWTAAVLGAAVVALLGFLFADRFRFLYSGWVNDDNYSHGFLVPVVSAWLAWEVLRRHGWTGQGNTVAGLSWLTVGCGLLLWGDIVGWMPIDFMALVMTLYGLAVLAGGRAWAQRFLFPILFLFFMFPLSPVLLNYAATWLQDKVATGGTVLLQLFVPAHQIGNKIYLPGQHIEIGEQCSGLRQIVAFAALALLVAYLSPRRLPFRLGIILAGLPIAIVANLLRVLLMAYLVLHFGSASISERETLLFGISYHAAWGLLTMAVGLGLLLAVAWWLGRVFPGATPAEPPTPAPPSSLSAGLSTAFLRRLGGAVLCLGAAIGLHVALREHLAAAREVIAQSTSLTKPLQGNADRGFPVSLGAWYGRDESPDPAARPFFNQATDRLNRVYVQKDEDGRVHGPRCTLYMVHFLDAKDREHHPLVCYAVQGCMEEHGGRQEVTGMTEPGAAAQRFCFTRPKDARYLSYVYYWHYTFVPPDEPGLSLWQRLHANWVKRPSLTVEVFTTARTAEELEQAAGFVRLVDERLQAHLPPGARRGSETLPITPRR
jgi:exosortase